MGRCFQGKLIEICIVVIVNQKGNQCLALLNGGPKGAMQSILNLFLCHALNFDTNFLGDHHS
jgi:hypothetical protein